MARKSIERLPFAGAVVRPERVELVADREHPPQVFQPPLPAVDRPQRVTLEVEEQIALVGIGQHHQRLRVDDVIGRFAVRPVGHLQPCLRGQRGDRPGGQFGHRAGVPGQVVHGGDARVDQPGALADPHAGDQQQVVVRADLCLAFGTAEAGPDALVLPRHRPAAGQMPVEQAL